MTKKSKKPQLPARPASPSPPPSVGSSTPVADSKVTAEQAGDLELLATLAEELVTEVGDPVPPPPGLTVSQAINSAWDAERRLNSARRDAEQAREAAKEEARSTKRAAEEAEQLLKKQRDEVARQESELRRRTEQLDGREQSLLEKEVRLTEREQNAAAGFLEERRRMVAGLEEQLGALRAEEGSRESSAAARRSQEEAAWRERIEARTDQWHREEEARSLRWQGEDEARLRATAEEHRRLSEDFARKATEQLQRLRVDEEALEEQRRTLDADRKALRAERSAVAAARELLDEDQQALPKKIERVAAARVADLEEALRAERERSAQVTAQRDAYFSRLEAFQELERRFVGQSPEQTLDRMQQLERETGELRAKVRDGLGEASTHRLAELERKHSAWLEEKAVMHAQLADAEARLGRMRLAAVEIERLRDHAEALETSRRLLGAALKELRTEVDSYTQADEKRNPMEALVKLDEDEDLQTEVRTRPAPGGAAPTLGEFSTGLRHWIARALPGRTLYYSERDLRCFLGGLAMSRLMLLQGISGTGKTSLPLAFAAAIGAEYEVVEVQAGWRDKQDLIGYYNAFHRHFYATNFLQALYRAGTPKCRNRPFFIVLDEINLSRVEQFFADFLSALEQPEEGRRLTLLNDPIPAPPALLRDGRHLPIPPNVWFIGTANHDESTTEFADKTYDRAHIMELPRRDPGKDSFDIHRAPAGRDPFSFQWLTSVFAGAQGRQQEGVQKALAWLRGEDGVAKLLDARFRVGWGNRLERDVEQFVPVVVEAGGTVGEALDHLFASKVLRKLRDRHDVSARGLEELHDRLEASWGSFGGAPTRSLDLIGRELRAKQDEKVEE
jgi:hypothetical protein